MIIELTRRFSVLTPKAKAKIEGMRETFLKKFSGQEATDEEGKTAEWYKTIGIPVPEELSEDNSAQQFISSFTKEDYRKVKSRLLVPFQFVDCVEEHLEGGSILFFASGREFVVEETIDEITRLVGDKNEEY